MNHSHNDGKFDLPFFIVVTGIVATIGVIVATTFLR